MNILVNLPETFFTQPELTASFDRLQKHGEVRQTSHNTPDEIAEDLKWADAVVMWSWPVLDSALLDRTGDLVYAGHIDVSQRGAQDELARNIPVSCSRGGWSPAVSEIALGFILSGLRRISDYHMQMRQGTEKWVESLPADIDPLERQLTGRTVGIVGLGMVGQRLAQFLQPFDVDLKVVDPYVPDEVIARYNGERVDCDTMVELCDVMVLSAASNEGTQKLINADRIARMRQNALFVNVARAALVDTDALIARLKQGDLFAAIDVFEEEPLPADSELRKLPNAWLTPHRAGGLISSVQRCVNWLIDDLEKVIEDQPRQYVVTEKMIPSLDS